MRLLPLIAILIVGFRTHDVGESHRSDRPIRKHEMARTVCALLLTLAVVALAGAGQLTSLGDAAKKAEESRKAAPPPSFTVKDLAGDVEWIITREGLEEYATARVEIAAIRRKTPVLHTRLFEASRRAATLARLAPALSAEPTIVQALSRFSLNSREYLRREQALINATAWAAQKQLPDSLKSRPIRVQNVTFVRNNATLLRDLTARYQKAEGASPPWFNASRFVEQP